MGTSESAMSRSCLKSALEFYGDADTPSGKLKIYKYGELFLQSVTYSAATSSHLNSLTETLRIFTKQERNLQRVYHIQLESVLTCMREYRLNILCDHYTYTLRDAIDRKVGKSKFLREQQVWYVLKVIVEAGYFLQKRQLVIGDIRTDTLFVTHQHQLRIPTVQIRNSFENSSYQQGLLCFKQRCLVSPEQMQQLREGKLSPINYYKSDVWALGMTLLECCSNMDSSTRFYKYSQFGINYPKIQTALSQLRNFYSNVLVDLLTQMLSMDVHSRPDFRYLCGWLDSKPRLNVSNSLNLDEKSCSTMDESTGQKKKLSLRK